VRKFDPVTPQTTARALSRAWHMLLRTRPQAAQDAERQQHLLRSAIAEVAARGERNEIRLAVLAVAKLEARLDGYEPTPRGIKRLRGKAPKSAA
jgi:hypothetical protein